MTTRREHLSKTGIITVATIETRVPALAVARDLVERFHRMPRTPDTGALTPWLADAAEGLLASFGNGISADFAAGTGAFSAPWCNGQTEDQIIKLQLVKRQMSGRAKLDLLRSRLIVPA